jgi:hypothetical protein
MRHRAIERTEIRREKGQSSAERTEGCGKDSALQGVDGRKREEGCGVVEGR